jgi:ribosome-binding factor A
MENRGAQHRRERLADALRDELGAILEGELADPRIGLATVSEITLAADRRSARVFVRVEGGEREAEQTLEGLEAAKGFIRRQLVERLGLRRAPELFFYVDHSEEYRGRIDELLARIQKKKKPSSRSGESPGKEKP